MDAVYGRQWENAITEEREDLLSHGKWDYVDKISVPTDRELIGCR
jgi:hypothetical protein